MFVVYSGSEMANPSPVPMVTAQQGNSFGEKLLVWLLTNVSISVGLLVIAELIKKPNVSVMDYLSAAFSNREMLLVFVALSADGLGSAYLARQVVKKNYERIFVTASVGMLVVTTLISVFLYCFQPQPYTWLLIMILICSIPGKAV
jgi:hypothetical protein